MNAISSAAPCHVRVYDRTSRDGGRVQRFDVACWTVDTDGLPVPWFVEDGRLLNLTLADLDGSRYQLVNGTVADWNKVTGR